MQRSVHHILIVFATTILSPTVRADDALHRVTFSAGKQMQTVDGRILVVAQDGGILLESRDGVLWNITPKNMRQRRKTGKTYSPMTAKELAASLQSELGRGFAIRTTKHYVICSNAGRFYSQWCGTLFERLLRGFLAHWKSLKYKEPSAHLSAVVFADRKQYAAYATRDAGPAMATSVGYYSARTNRVVLLDLSAGGGARPARSVRDVVRKVGKSPFNVATVVHEATHQIAFNCGMHTRYADNPVWLTEGLAMYFEPPDLRSPTGWTTAGKRNPFRAVPFQKFAASGRKPDSLTSLVASDERFVDARTAGNAYAESWALTYFLIRERRKDFEAYLKMLSKKPRINRDKPPQRLKDFHAAFGDAEGLEKAFARFAKRRLR